MNFKNKDNTKIISLSKNGEEIKMLNAQKFDDYYVAFLNGEYNIYNKDGKLINSESYSTDKIYYKYGNIIENGFYTYNAENGKISFKIYEIHK